MWLAYQSDQLLPEVLDLISTSKDDIYFSAVNLWEITIKKSLGRSDFIVNPTLIYEGLLENGYLELPICSKHGLEVSQLPDIHKDPFDRMLIAQARCEDLILMTADHLIFQYPVKLYKI
ncbi:type II toxin-antitoxin system VapC family toxin [Acinetobacter sp. VNH17]|uniref:Type II toxin-antitoxin system VapC family toxin n=1 Tax=Acinetobacter thutiue TaxID=2998078 RepID=A0ABT7WLR5_9GAMM|nr:type II toxin-antitoxin system VapC family toxin [Acinetobacter thutiue]MCY6411503.1 type II toxin-antitoxin system VapC family toxin [Acinetobacter thutiue]MDN0013605.1 type II toxin-antitoxin system VapC family toxin [Acinetobacter thutiue]